MLALAAALLLPAVQAAPADSLGNAWLVQVKPGPRRYFHEEVSGKPLRRAAYVVPGDRLVATAVKAGFTAVTFVSSDGRTRTGWIESIGLARVPAPTAFAWTGNWNGGDARIDIKPGRGGGLHLQGSATWGSHDPDRVARGGVNFGEFEVDVVGPRGDRIAFSVADSEPGMVARPYGEAPEEDHRCRVALRLLGPYLLARDNNRCGGHNVTFTGTYRYQPKAR